MNDPAPTRLDPDELAALEDQRDHLLASLDDLEREHDAGDLDDDDYRELRDDYTARAAEVLRAIDERRSVMVRSRPTPNRGRNAAVVVAVLAFAVVAGLLVARGSGERGGGSLTGNSGDLRTELADCQPLAFRSPARGVRCYQRILGDSPDNVEALTYQGWAYIRDGRVLRGKENLDRVVRLDPDYPDARVFRAIVLARAGEAAGGRGDAATAREAFGEAARELDRFYRNDPPQVAVQVLRQELLEFKVFLGLLSPDTASCWASSLSERTGQLDQAFYDALGSCLDDVLARSPDDADALLTRALSALGPDRQDTAAARADVERVLALAPDVVEPGQSANARLLRASLDIVAGRFDEAGSDLDQLDGVPRPTAAFLVGSPSDLRRALDAARRAATSTTAPATTAPPGRVTTTTRPQVSVSTVPGAPVLPNPGNG